MDHVPRKQYGQFITQFSSPLCPERRRGPLILLSNGYQGLFPWG